MAIGIMSGIGDLGSTPTPSTDKFYQIKMWDNANNYTVYFISKTPIYNITDLRDYVGDRQITVYGYFYGSTRNTAVNFPEFITKDNLNIKIHYTQYTVSNASAVRASTFTSQTFILGSITCTEIV